MGFAPNLRPPGALASPTHSPWSWYAGAIAGHGRTISLAPGRQATLTTLIDAASCMPADGYTVPPGDYEVRAWLSFGADRARLSESATVRVVAPVG